jgi:hypothetical protein
MVANSDSKTAPVSPTPVFEVKQVETPTYRVPKPSGPNKIFTKEGAHGDWRDDLIRDGYYVVKGAVPKELIEKYGDDMLSYLENF